MHQQGGPDDQQGRANLTLLIRVRQHIFTQGLAERYGIRLEVTATFTFRGAITLLNAHLCFMDGANAVAAQAANTHIVAMELNHGLVRYPALLV